MMLAEMSGFPTSNKVPMYDWRNPKYRRPVPYLFERYSQIGIVPAEHGCVAIDLDIKGGVNGKDNLFNRFPNLPKSMNYRTTSGGWHLWYSVPEGSDIPQRNGALPGVDIRYADGYVCVGKDYEVAGGRIEVCPDYLLEWLKERPRTYVGRVVNDMGTVKAVDPCKIRYNVSPIPKGRRNDTLYRWGFGLLNGVKKGELSIEDFEGLMNMRGTNSGLSINEIDLILESLLHKVH